MGFMLRVRLASFFAGAAVAGAAGGYFLYKDYKLAHDSMALQVLGYAWSVRELGASVMGIGQTLVADGVAIGHVLVQLALSAITEKRIGHNWLVKVKGLHDSTDARYKALEKRLAALEGQQTTEAALEMDTPSN